MKRDKITIGFWTGFIFACGGTILSLKAHSLAWPYLVIYSGKLNDTQWAVNERLYQNIGLLLAGFGLVILTITFLKWFDKSTT